MSNLRELAYRVDPALWVREVLGVEPTKWQEEPLAGPICSSFIIPSCRLIKVRIVDGPTTPTRL